MNIRVAIVVLNWNSYEDTEKCIISLLNQNYSNYSVIVIDNGSTDDSPRKLRSLKNSMSDNRLSVIYNDSNKGFAGGVNTGISYALSQGFEAVALFNNDATADPQWLNNLVKHFNKTDTGIITGLLLREDGITIDSTGDFYSIWGMPFPRSRNKKTNAAPESGYVFGASGGASLYKSALFKDIGLFDEKFFAYYEDVDISFRAQLYGYKVYYSKDSVAYHKQGATSKKIPGFTVIQTFKNIPLLFIKNVPISLMIPVGTRLLILYTLIFANALRNGNGIHATKGFLKSIFYILTDSAWKRRTIQKNKKVDTSYIKSIIYNDLPPDQTGVRKLLNRK